MTNAARTGDPIGHSPAVGWLVKGLLIGAAVGVAAVAIAGTGGLAAVAIVGGLAAGGAGVGELLSGMSWAPKEESGYIISGSPDVFINNRPAARAHIDKTICSKHSVTPQIATGSATVFINDMHAARVDDRVACGAVIIAGSPNVIIGGGTAQTDAIQPEDLIPALVHGVLLAVGIGSAVILGGPVVAMLGLVGATGGGVGCSWLGGKIFGEGSDGQKWMMLGGSILGGMAGIKGGMSAVNKAIPFAKTPHAGFLKGGVQGYRKGLAYDFYKGQGMREARINRHLEGIDFNKPVSVETLPTGKRVTQYQIPGSPQGNYYAKHGTPIERLGISTEAQTTTGEILPRQPHEYVTNKPVRVLKSTAKDINDDWSVPGQNIPSKGGEYQYYTMDKGAFTPYP